MEKFHTNISKSNYDYISRQELSPAELIQFLEEGALYRSFADSLRAVYPGDDLVTRLADGLAGCTGKEYTSMLRKIRNWMSGDYAPKNREQLFQVCFALGLDEKDSSCLIASASETGIHYRNPGEMIYAFALRKHKTYQEAQELKKALLPACEEGMKKAKADRGSGEMIYTSQLKDEFAEVDTEDELKAFFEDYSGHLGEIHETVYQKFMEMLGALQNPEEGAENYTVKSVVDQFMRMHVPYGKKTGDYTYLQRVVKKDWPSEREILKMKNRKRDVSRKVLLLLFLITGDFEFSPEYEESREEKYHDIYFEDLLEESPLDRLEVRLSKINQFLEHYGMNLLDPGSPFDCIVLYALRMQYEDTLLSESAEAALELLFEKEDE